MGAMKETATIALVGWVWIGWQLWRPILAKIRGLRPQQSHPNSKH